MNNDIVDNFQNKANEIENQLEQLGKMICSLPRSGAAWQHVNRAINELHSAVAVSYQIVH